MTFDDRRTTEEWSDFTSQLTDALRAIQVRLDRLEDEVFDGKPPGTGGLTRNLESLTDELEECSGKIFLVLREDLNEELDRVYRILAELQEAVEDTDEDGGVMTMTAETT